MDRFSDRPGNVIQVIELLRKAIEDPSIRVAAQELVLHVFVQEPAVRDALIQTLQDLGHEQVVQEAVVQLLTESTHTTLNDPEILEHSMEFATDVVGDDIVQRTAGEALRKSVGHAVRPATTVFLTSMGVGLIIFGVVAVGYSRSSERDVALFESAVKSLQSNTMYGIHRMITWPVRQFGSILSNFYVAELLGIPWWKLLGDTTKRWMSSFSSRLVNGTQHAWTALQSLYHHLFARTNDNNRSRRLLRR